MMLTTMGTRIAKSWREVEMAISNLTSPHFLVADDVILKSASRRTLVTQDRNAMTNASYFDGLPMNSFYSQSEDDVWHGAVNPRAFAPWPIDLALPCFPPDDEVRIPALVHKPHSTPVTEGFLFLKTFKTASSTSAGVNLRIARNVANRTHNGEFEFCQSRFNHGKPWDKHGTLFRDRKIGRSFLWAILRDPTKRVISQFFHFKVSRLGVEPTDEAFIEFLRSRDRKNVYIRSLSSNHAVPKNTTSGIRVANEIIRDFDFIGVSERIDEVSSFSPGAKR